MFTIRKTFSMFPYRVDWVHFSAVHIKNFLFYDSWRKKEKKKQKGERGEINTILQNHILRKTWLIRTTQLFNYKFQKFLSKSVNFLAIF